MSESQTAAHPGTSRRRLVVLLAAGLAFLLVLFLPPYINVSRYQRRVARNIGNALGRPVHFDNITLNLLPVPGITLENFVVDEDPAFGFEPILRASQVRANLRLRSLWSRHVEFSRIVLTDPSVNLVRTADGHWNIQGLLLQASRTEAGAAPTAQKFAGSAPRFPYIEASGARLNLKLEQAKTPFSLTDADFALWLPQPRQWRLRLEAHPVRTDTSPADTGTLRVEATLGAPEAGATAVSFANLPIDLHATWQNVQLGGLSRLLIADDAGLRGELNLSVNLLGTLGRNSITSQLQLSNARRADFVPPRLLSIDADCHATALNFFHAFSNVECHWPPSASSGPSNLILTANLPDLRQPNSASATLTLPALPASTLIDWLGVATSRPPTGLAGPGTLAANLAWGTTNQLQPDSKTAGAPSIPRPLRKGWESTTPAQPVLTGELEFSNESLEIDPLNHRSIPLGDLLFQSTPPPAGRSPHHRHAALPVAQPSSFDLAPIALPLGGKQSATLDGRIDATGYTLHLTGTVILGEVLRLGRAVPQFGDGLEDVVDKIADSAPEPCPPGMSGCGPAAVMSSHPLHIDLTATRAWGGPQTWRQTTPAPAHPRHRTGD
jgi:AsmA protein